MLWGGKGHMRKVFLDDKRQAPKGYILVTSAKQCIQLLKEEKVSVISLDYNLGYKKPKGYQVAKYMVDKKVFPDKIIIHSNSRRGRLKMYRLLFLNKPKKVLVYIRPLPTPF
jgi:hypothetical protein